jgi:hypothetical protein
MKKVLALLLLACSIAAWAQSPSNQVGTSPLQQAIGVPYQLAGTWTFTAASGSTAAFPIRGLSYYQITFVPNGTVGSCALSFDSAAAVNSSGAPVSPATGGVIASSTIGSCASAGAYSNATAAGISNFGVLTPTIVGSGSVTFTVFGYIQNPASAGGGGSAITSPIDGSGFVEVNCKTGCSATALGQTTMAASEPVAIASNQSAIPSSQSGTWNVGLSAGANTIGAVTQASGPWTSNVTQVAGSALGAPSNYGTSPGAVAVTGVNAFITNVAAVTTQATGFGAVIGFQQSATASAVALASNASHSFCVQALPANTINVYVGPSGITTSTGFPLQPGQSACWQLSNTNLVYVIASTTGAGVAVSGT